MGADSPFLREFKRKDPPSNYSRSERDEAICALLILGTAAFAGALYGFIKFINYMFPEQNAGNHYRMT